MKKAHILLFSLLLMAIAAACKQQPSSAPSVNARKIMYELRADSLVQQFLHVRSKEGSEAHIQFYVKQKVGEDRWAWVIDREFDGYIGRLGAGKAREGDARTPVGLFSVQTAFGIKPNPGTPIEYIDVTEDTWACGCEKYYNQIISAAKTGHRCEEDGEHMYYYSPEYNYGLFIDYNKECIPGLGSAIFIHCTGTKPYTGGCVAMSEEDMKYILCHIDGNVKVCIE